MKFKLSVAGLLIGCLLIAAGGAAASTCVDCHTDAKRLEAIAKTLPQKEASAETAGKG